MASRLHIHTFWFISMKHICITWKHDLIPWQWLIYSELEQMFPFPQSRGWTCARVVMINVDALAQVWLLSSCPTPLPLPTVPARSREALQCTTVVRGQSSVGATPSDSFPLSTTVWSYQSVRTAGKTLLSTLSHEYGTIFIMYSPVSKQTEVLLKLHSSNKADSVSRR